MIQAKQITVALTSNKTHLFLIFLLLFGVSFCQVAAQQQKTNYYCKWCGS